MQRLFQYSFKTVSRSFVTHTFFSTMPQLYQKRIISTDIKLNSTEIKIRDLLNEFCHFYNNETNTKIVLRVTGGWVRDKLLGDESNDLDIAIDHLSGEEFTEKLMSYIAQYKNDDKDLKTHSVHKIEKNPEKSKHLETCTTKLYGLDIDFVNLRNEEYTEDSRIPTISYGTPQEDAYRRDATLNALFYNLSTGQVEDFTERGIEDLSNGILRTPLEPHKTFLDDPLRCLRLIRFAARFGFSVDPDAISLMRDEEIRLALMKKISRERIGVEIHKILQSEKLEYGLQLIYETELYVAIFNFGDMIELVEKLNPDKLKEIETLYQKSNEDLKNFSDNISRSYQLISQSSLQNPFTDFIHDKQNKKLLYLSLILHNYQGFGVVNNIKKKFNSTCPAVKFIIQNGLKFGTKESYTVTMVVDQSEEFDTVMRNSLDSQNFSRSTLGLMMRKYGNSQNWEIAFWYNLIRQLSFTDLQDSLVQTYTQFSELIHEQKLSNIWNEKLILDGKSMLLVLQMKPGPWMKGVNDEVLVWQLDHPDQSRELCIDYVKEILPKYVK